MSSEAKILSGLEIAKWVFKIREYVTLYIWFNFDLISQYLENQNVIFKKLICNMAGFYLKNLKRITCSNYAKYALILIKKIYWNF